MTDTFHTPVRKWAVTPAEFAILTMIHFGSHPLEVDLSLLSPELPLCLEMYRGDFDDEPFQVDYDKEVYKGGPSNFEKEIQQDVYCSGELLIAFGAIVHVMAIFDFDEYCLSYADMLDSVDIVDQTLKGGSSGTDCRTTSRGQSFEVDREEDFHYDIDLEACLNLAEGMGAGFGPISKLVNSSRTFATVGVSSSGHMPPFEPGASPLDHLSPHLRPEF
ncbi:hypothetical protein JCGZ_00102 [Jatropha curcas]|uniref:Uncharacterized protein n=1 Tax=Jatropha curcas TaxID=180498 RepID=A0A067JLZ1_JATCU|nr:hypothetical protein JCGZ_00102 [Jatropha curcas]